MVLENQEKLVNDFSFNTDKVGLLMVFFQTITNHFELHKKFRAVVEYDPERPTTRVKVFYD